MKLHNLTPHEINIIDTNGNIVLAIPSEGIARAQSTRTQSGALKVDGVNIPVNTTSFGEVENLPPQQEGHAYIVSVITAQAIPERKDVFITDDAVRDEQGRVIGCRALAHI